MYELRVEPKRGKTIGEVYRSNDMDDIRGAICDMLETRSIHTRWEVVELLPDGDEMTVDIDEID